MDSFSFTHRMMACFRPFFEACFDRINVLKKVLCWPKTFTQNESMDSLCVKDSDLLPAVCGLVLELIVVPWLVSVV